MWIENTMIQHGIKIVFGMGKCPELPAGFVLTEPKEKTFRTAEDWEGKEYLIALEPNRLVPILRRWEHNTQADFDNAIPF